MDTDTLIKKFNIFICSGMSYATMSHKLILENNTKIPVAFISKWFYVLFFISRNIVLC